MTERKEILFEFIVVGRHLKTIAVDPETGVEAAVVGPATAAQSHMERLAARKLERALRAYKSSERGASR